MELISFMVRIFRGSDFNTSRDVNVLFFLNDRFVMNTSRKIEKRNDRFQKRSFFKKFVFKKLSFIKRSFL